MRSIMADYAANYAILEALVENMGPCAITYFGPF